MFIKRQLQSLEPLLGWGPTRIHLRTDVIHDPRGWRSTNHPPTALTPPRRDAKGENSPITKRDTELMVTNVFSRRKMEGKGL